MKDKIISDRFQIILYGFGIIGLLLGIVYFFPDHKDRVDIINAGIHDTLLLFAGWLLYGRSKNKD